MAFNWRMGWRKVHRWGSILIAIPFLVVIVSGLLLQLKKQVPWVQPPTQKGTTSELKLSLEELLAAVSKSPEAEIKSWEDVERIDIQPKRGLAKVISKNSWEVQVDLGTAEILQVAYRRSDWIEAMHDGSWFHPAAKLWVFLPSAVVVLVLWLTGIYLFFLPWTVRWSKKRKAAMKSTGP